MSQKMSPILCVAFHMVHFCGKDKTADFYILKKLTMTGSHSDQSTAAELLRAPATSCLSDGQVKTGGVLSGETKSRC